LFAANGKWDSKLPFVCCKWIREWRFVFLGWQMRNGNQRLLFPIYAYTVGAMELARALWNAILKVLKRIVLNSFLVI
jgi:hypothetical protein